MKPIISFLLFAITLNACTRNISEGEVVIQVEDFRDRQPMGLTAVTAASQAPYRLFAEETSAPAQPMLVCLVPADTPADELGSIEIETCTAADVDGMAFFSRQEGTMIALVDANRDGLTDAIVYNVEPGVRQVVGLTHINSRTDGGYLIADNNKVIYQPGDTIIVTVRGWLPQPELVHVQIWNNWNGGFHYWSSEERNLDGEVRFQVQMTIPLDWPHTNDSTGAAYFSYPVSVRGIYNGDNFVLLGKGGPGDEPVVGAPPVNGQVVIAGGAAAVSSTTVDVTLAAKGGAFYRLANDAAEIDGVPWMPLTNEQGTDALWMLLAGPDGPREVFAQFADKYGAVSEEIVSDTVELDATPIQILNLKASPLLGKAGTVFDITFELSEAATGGLSAWAGTAPFITACTGLQCSGIFTAQGTESEGALAIQIQAVDRVGWVTRAQTSVMLDFTPPETLLTGNVPAGTGNTISFSFGLAADEVGATFECSLDGAAFALCDPAVGLTGLTDGSYTFQARAIDPAGNVDPTPATATWQVDTTPPDTLITSAPASVVNVRSGSFTFSATTSDATGFYCRLDGGAFASCVSPVAYSLLAEGAHTFEVRAVDAAGNVDPSPAAYPWVVDTLAPDTLIASAPQATLASNTATVVFYSTAGDVTQYECSLNGAAYADCVSAVQLSGLNEGLQTFLVRAYDLAGNVDATPALAAWYVDTTPPETQITSGPPTRTQATVAAFTFTSPSTDVAGYECRIDSALFAACASGVSYATLTAGSHTFEVRARDLAGSYDPTPSIHIWTVDHTPPETVITSAPPAATYATSASLAFTSPSSDVASFECSLDGAAFADCTSPKAYSGLLGGAHTFLARAIDTSGNFDTSPASATWVIDNDPPETTILSGPAARVNTATANFTFASDEIGSTFECSLNGAAFLACANPLALAGLGGADHTLLVRAVDLGGNIDPSPAAQLWRVDLTPPLTTIVQAPHAVTKVTSAIFAFGANEPATYRCEVDGNGGMGFAACNSPAFFPGLTDGTHTFRVYATDLAGNIESLVQVHTWLVDSIAPQITNIVVGPPVATTGDTVTITFDVSEPVAGISVQIAGAAAAQQTVNGQSYTFSYSVSGLENEGGNAVVIVATDAAGNTGSGAGSATFDFTPPETYAGPALPPVYTNALDALIDFSASEPGSFECSVNGAAFANCLPPHQETPLVEGVYDFEVRAIDAVGLVDQTPAHVQWTVDYTPPGAPKLLSVIVNPPLSADMLIGATGAVEGAALVTVYADAALSIVLATVTANADGSFGQLPIGDDVGDALQQVYVTAQDAAGNESAATPVRNPRIPPRVTRALIQLAFSSDANGNSIGNPADSLLVTWDNTADGDNNAIVTTASVTMPGLGIGAVAMSDDGTGIFSAIVPLVAGPYDGLFGAELTVVGEAGLTTGPVLSINQLSIDVEAPLPPTMVTGVNTGTQLTVDWTQSGSADAASYLVYHGDEAADEVFGLVYAPLLSFSDEVSACTEQHFGVRTIDDAGNESGIITDGPVLVSVATPTILAWGAIGGAKAKVMSAVGASHVELHFDMVTQAAGPAPWTTTYTALLNSPLDVGLGITSLAPLKPGTEYIVSGRSVKSTCTSEFSSPVTVKTLDYVDHQGGVAICPGCTNWGIPGRWYFGGLGFAVAGVGDAWGSDGKEDILTGVPGQTLAVLVNADPITEAAIVYDYFATLDIVGGGPNLASAGDVNGDGKEDFLIGSPMATAGGKAQAGNARVVDGVSRTTLFTVGGTEVGQQLGYSVWSLGDIHGADGKSEIIAGSVGCGTYSCSGTTATAGVVKIIDSSGTVLQTHIGDTVGSFFGVSVHGGVDFNGDGVGDYAVGAPGHVGAGAPVGSVHVFSGTSHAKLLSVYGNMDEKFGFSVRLVRANGTAGNAARLIVGAPSRYGVTGRTYIYDSNGSQIALLDGDIPEASANFGASLATGGDFDGDGVYEIIVGDPNIPLSSMYGHGNAYVYAVDTGTLLFEMSGGEPDGALGYAMDYLGDNNGDGVQEIVLGAPGAAIDGLYNAGRLYVVSIKAAE